jgi:hypothetical protein
VTTVKKKSQFLLLHIDFRALFGLFENLISSQNQPFLLLKKTLSKNNHNKVYLDLFNGVKSQPSTAGKI